MKKEKFFIIIPLIMVIFLTGSFFINNSQDSNSESIEKENKLLSDKEKIYICDYPNLSMECNALSKVNGFGAQTRCYYFTDRLTYKICKDGWRAAE